jgi:hypothetical protein
VKEVVPVKEELKAQSLEKNKSHEVATNANEKLVDINANAANSLQKS